MGSVLIGAISALLIAFILKRQQTFQKEPVQGVSDQIQGDLDYNNNLQQ
jgi:hypothetical protein